MIKFCKYAWDKNADKLRKILEESENKYLFRCQYKDLVSLVVKTIFNNATDLGGHIWDADSITEIDNGDYQGTLLFTIPEDTYQPASYQYLMTFVEYGSCSVCDTLQAIQCCVPYTDSTEKSDSVVDDFMALCRDIVANTIHPFNTGWRNEDLFDPAEEEMQK